MNKPKEMIAFHPEGNRTKEGETPYVGCVVMDEDGVRIITGTTLMKTQMTLHMQMWLKTIEE